MFQKIVPNIWFSRNAEQAAEFYASAFESAVATVESRYPQEGLLDFQREFAGEALTVSLTVSGYQFILINAGDEFTPNPAISFMLNFDPLLFDGDAELARAALDRLWGELVPGGVVLMELGNYPFSEHYGWVQDRFGVSWQLMLTDPAGARRPFILPSLLFCGSVQNRAHEAVDYYLETFIDDTVGTTLGQRLFYDESHGSDRVGAVLFSDFSIANEWLVAMDSGIDQNLTFTPGISLEVRCEDQPEIDHYWSRLSAVPEAEQCGWLVDQFGVSWQIVPKHMDELMQRPGAFERMLQMKKLVIADF